MNGIRVSQSFFILKFQEILGDFKRFIHLFLGDFVVNRQKTIFNFRRFHWKSTKKKNSTSSGNMRKNLHKFSEILYQCFRIYRVLCDFKRIFQVFGVLGEFRSGHPGNDWMTRALFHFTSHSLGQNDVKMLSHESKNRYDGRPQ